MKNMMKNAAILFAITVIAGFILGFVYQNTKDLITEREEQDKKAACMEVFTDASDFEKTEFVFDEKTIKDFVQNEFENETINETLKAVDKDGNTLGYVVTVTTSRGYGGNISFSVGIRNDGTVNGISILSISETAGLGMEAENVLKPQFVDKKAEQFEYTKTGATATNQIDAISGATITTNAITTGVNASLHYFNTVLGGGNANE